MKVRAKFQVESVTSFAFNPGAVRVKFSAVSADGVPENESFSRYTPSGSMEMFIDNPPVGAYFREQLGKHVYLDVTSAEVPAQAPPNPAEEPLKVPPPDMASPG